jgi:hypothetical protein
MILNTLTFNIYQLTEGDPTFTEKWNAFKSAVIGIWQVFALIGDVLGFLGLRVLVLLIINFFFLWFLNLISPLDKKLNYFLSVAVGLYVAIRAKMPFSNVISKYLLVIFFPYILSYSIHYGWKFLKWFFTPVKKTSERDPLYESPSQDNTNQQPPQKP